MTSTAKTFDEAYAIACDLRAINRGTDWVVKISRPLFDGDLYYITVE
jgi:hypothetical protein